MRNKYDMALSAIGDVACRPEIPKEEVLCDLSALKEEIDIWIEGIENDD